MNRGGLECIVNAILVNMFILNFHKIYSHFFLLYSFNSDPSIKTYSFMDINQYMYLIHMEII